MPEDRLEDVGFAAKLMRCRGGDADTLCVDHFAHDAAGAVGRANEHLGLALGKLSELVNAVGNNSLQAAEERVAARIRSCQEDAKPAEKGGKKGISAAG